MYTRHLLDTTDEAPEYYDIWMIKEECIKMMQKDKELVLKDLCARLPYGVFCNIGLDYPLPLQRLFVDKLDGILLDFYEDGKDYQVYLSEVKPYLFPMSSMTEEQEKEYNNLNSYELSCFPHTEEALDYLIKNHFDYRYLIDEGLAIDATNLNIY